MGSAGQEGGVWPELIEIQIQGAGVAHPRACLGMKRAAWESSSMHLALPRSAFATHASHPTISLAPEEHSHLPLLQVLDQAGQPMIRQLAGAALQEILDDERLPHLLVHLPRLTL